MSATVPTSAGNRPPAPEVPWQLPQDVPAGGPADFVPIGIGYAQDRATLTGPGDAEQFLPVGADEAVLRGEEDPLNIAPGGCAVDAESGAEYHGQASPEEPRRRPERVDGFGHCLPPRLGPLSPHGVVPSPAAGPAADSIPVGPASPLRAAHVAHLFPQLAGSAFAPVGYAPGAAALTIATMPALRASGRLGQAATTAARSGSGALSGRSAARMGARMESAGFCKSARGTGLRSGGASLPSWSRGFDSHRPLHQQRLASSPVARGFTPRGRGIRTYGAGGKPPRYK